MAWEAAIIHPGLGERLARTGSILTLASTVSTQRLARTVSTQRLARTG